MNDALYIHLSSSSSSHLQCCATVELGRRRRAANSTQDYRLLWSRYYKRRYSMLWNCGVPGGRRVPLPEPELGVVVVCYDRRVCVQAIQRAGCSYAAGRTCTIHRLPLYVVRTLPWRGLPQPCAARRAPRVRAIPCRRVAPPHSA